MRRVVSVYVDSLKLVWQIGTAFAAVGVIVSLVLQSLALPAGRPESPPTNTQDTTAGFAAEDLEARTTVESWRRARSRDAFAPSDPAGRITTKEVHEHSTLGVDMKLLSID